MQHPQAEVTTAARAPAPGSGSAAAHEILEQARRHGDERKEIFALTDLAILLLLEGNTDRAQAFFSKAWGIAERLDDRPAEMYVLDGVGLAGLVTDQPYQAIESFGRELWYARASSDRIAEKVALSRLGLTYVRLGMRARALTYFEEALRLARELGDRLHEVELLWSVGIQHAELAHREEAIAHVQAAVDLLVTMGKPQAAWFAYHLEVYRAETANNITPQEQAQQLTSAEIHFSRPDTERGQLPNAGLAGVSQAPSASRLVAIPLRTAMAMAKFVASGLKTATPETLQSRLSTCAGCEHHSGLRCRVCGCFTGIKARIAEEECPLRRWEQ
jgi:tetratricopeptide (TPR) repeat protein